VLVLFAILLGIALSIPLNNLGRQVWWERSIYDGSIHKQINDYKLTEEYKIYKAIRDIKEKQ
jgi:hypothetical protein